MRHHNTKRKFGRFRKGRKALLNSLALNLIMREKIKTTLPKAKELKPMIEKFITRAKKNDLATHRLIIGRLGGRGREVKKLFDILAPKYSDRNGGYTRVLKLGTRTADGAPMAIIEFI
jgi:large subunit ribosomal protein L17